MESLNDIPVVLTPGGASRATYGRRLRRLAVTGLVATAAAMVVTTLGAALAQSWGVEFVLSDTDDSIPLPGFGVVTGLFSVIGVVIASALLRWSARLQRDSCGRP